jgi:hypothetical protein
LNARTICATPCACCGRPAWRCSNCASRVPSATITVSVPVAFDGIAIGMSRVTSSPRYERMSTFSGTVRPGRTSVVSSQTRSMVAVRGSSDEAMLMSSASISTGSKSFLSRNVSGPAT